MRSFQNHNLFLMFDVHCYNHNWPTLTSVRCRVFCINTAHSQYRCFHKAFSALEDAKNTNIDGKVMFIAGSNHHKFFGVGSCVDFLDGWLNLVEKLLNTQSIMDSPHVIATAPSTGLSSTTPQQQQLTFDALKFSMKAQQVQYIMYLQCVNMLG